MKSQLADHAAILKDLTQTINKDRQEASVRNVELEELKRKGSDDCVPSSSDR